MAEICTKELHVAKRSKVVLWKTNNQSHKSTSWSGWADIIERVVAHMKKLYQRMMWESSVYVDEETVSYRYIRQELYIFVIVNVIERGKIFVGGKLLTQHHIIIADELSWSRI